ncbi:MAG: dihydroorotase [Saprospiraceae bacterium]|nr:dihydroorotase [Saprospiraceae bacterium]
MKVIDGPSKYHNKVVDILILDSRIAEIKAGISPASPIKTIQGEDLHVSISWLDIGTQVGEPGLEHREDWTTVSKAAKAGGYGAIAPFPNTQPSIQHKADIQYIKQRAKSQGIGVYPIASLSIDNQGAEISEMYDLFTAGAAAFSDGLKSVSHAGLLARALEYVKPFEGLIIHFPSEKYLTQDAQMHEGEMSTLLGMKGMPSTAEAIGLKRDLELLAYTQSRLCVYGLSSYEAVKILKEAKKKAWQKKLTAAVPYLNLVYTDKEMERFDTHLKVMPPLRKKSDQNELIKALKDGVIDAIVSNHYPIEEEGKKLEFPYAKFGASGIETCFAACNTFVPALDLETLVDKLSYGPRSILGLTTEGIKAGSAAALTLFDPTAEWVFDESQSRSGNNPFLGKTLRGKVIDVLN